MYIIIKQSNISFIFLLNKYVPVFIYLCYFYASHKIHFFVTIMNEC